MITRRFQRRVKPTWSELRAAIHYTRKQLRIMFPHKKPQRHPKYRDLVLEIASYPAELRKLRKSA